MSHIEPRLYSDQQYRQIGMMGAWEALLDTSNAILHGFIQYRLPVPGKPIDVSEAETHIAHIEKEWEAEKMRRDPSWQFTSAPQFTSMDLNAKLYLHSILMDSKQKEETDI